MNVNLKEIIMKRRIAKAFTVVAVTALALGVASAANAQALGCSNATLRGTFAYTSTGSLVAVAPLGPYAETGTQTFDGSGGTATVAMASANGNIMPANTTGTYTVNPDCTGTFTLEIAPGITSHFSFVIDDSGNGFQAICLDPVAVITRIGRRLFPGRAI
jgi:hypothetical protein